MSFKLKELLEIAITELQTLTPVQYPDFRLEEAVYKEKEELWEIVVSYLVENTNKPINVIPLTRTEYKYLRLYKKLSINKNKEIVGFQIFNNKE